MPATALIKINGVIGDNEDFAINTLATFTNNDDTGVSTWKWEKFQGSGPADNLTGSTSPTATLTPRSETSFAIKLTVNEGLGDESIDIVVLRIRRLKTRHAVPAPGETTQVSSERGWASVAEPIINAQDDGIGDQGPQFGVAGENLAQLNVVRPAGTSTIKAGLPGEEKLPTFAKTPATSAALVKNTLYYVDRAPDGDTSPETGDIFTARREGLITGFSGSPVVNDPVYVSDAAGLSLTAGTNRRTVGYVVRSSAGSYDVWFDGGSGADITWPLLAPDGAFTAPSYSFINDPGLGMFRYADDSIGWATASLTRMVLDGSGNLGVGQVSPGNRVYLRGSSDADSYFRADSSTGVVQSFIGASSTAGAAGTISNHPFDLRTNNVARARVTTGGVLHVGSAASETFVATASLLRVEADSVASAAFRERVNDIEIEFGAASGFSAGFIQTATAHPLQVRTNTLARAQFDTSGNFAIGGDFAPSARVHARDSAANSVPAFRLQNDVETWIWSVRGDEDDRMRFGTLSVVGLDVLTIGKLELGYAGTSTVPAITTRADPDTGVWWSATNQVGFRAGGTGDLNVDINGTTRTSRVLVQSAGSAALTAFGNAGGTHGMYFAGDGVAFSVQSNAVLIVYGTSSRPSIGSIEHTPIAATSGSPTIWKTAGPAHTTLAADTEAIDIDFALSRTVQFTGGAGAFATQRAVVFRNPTYAFTSADTITDAATVAITNAPGAGTNATITNPWALWVQAGRSRFDDQIRAADGLSGTPSYGFTNSSGLGMYSPQANQLGWSTSSSLRVTLDSSSMSPGTTGVLDFGGSTKWWANAYATIFHIGNASTHAVIQEVGGNQDLRFQSAGGHEWYVLSGSVKVGSISSTSPYPWLIGSTADEIGYTDSTLRIQKTGVAAWAVRSTDVDVEIYGAADGAGGIGRVGTQTAHPMYVVSNIAAGDSGNGIVLWNSTTRTAGNLMVVAETASPATRFAIVHNGQVLAQPAPASLKPTYSAIGDDDTGVNLDGSNAGALYAGGNEAASWYLISTTTYFAADRFMPGDTGQIDYNNNITAASLEGIRFSDYDAATTFLAINCLDAEFGTDDTAIILRHKAGGTLQFERVTVGATDSGGSGFRVLRIPN